jgi:hypothetical protein
MAESENNTCRPVGDFRRWEIAHFKGPVQELLFRSRTVNESRVQAVAAPAKQAVFPDRVRRRRASDLIADI